MCVQSTVPRHCCITYQWQAPSLQVMCTLFWCNLAPGKWWQPYKLVWQWQKQLVGMVLTHWWFSGVFFRNFSSINTMCRSPLGKHPRAPAFFLFPPHARTNFSFRLIRADLDRHEKVFSPFPVNNNSIDKVVPVNVGLMVLQNTGTVTAPPAHVSKSSMTRSNIDASII